MVGYPQVRILGHLGLLTRTLIGKRKLLTSQPEPRYVYFEAQRASALFSYKSVWNYLAVFQMLFFNGAKACYFASIIQGESYMKREIQIHAAVSRIGAKLAILKEDREDQEICQFAVSYPAQFDGDIKKETVVAAFDNLKLACLQKMRESGMLRLGE